jgi:hypothetical protein
MQNLPLDHYGKFYFQTLPFSGGIIPGDGNSHYVNFFSAEAARAKHEI